MLRLLLRYPIRLLIAPDQPCPTPLRLLHNTVPKTLSPSISDLTISYLIGSCGLSPAAALSASKKFTLKTTDAADSFLSLLKSYAFTSPQIAYIISIQPELLTYNSEKKIKPKLEFFVEVGYCKEDIVNIVTNNPQILCFSLENRLRPNFHMLKSILSVDREFSIAILNASQSLGLRLEGVILPNMKILRDIGVPQHNVMKLVTRYPKALSKSTSRFSNDVALLKKIGFEVSDLMFIVGMNALCMLPQSSWDKKLALYRSFGWSEEETLTAFRRYPYCMSLSEENIKRHMNFFVGKLKFEPSYVARRPNFLAYSFEKRIYPRYKIFCLLESKGLPVRTKDFASFLHMSEKEFVNKYIIKHADQVPEVLKVYGGKLELFGYLAGYRQPHAVAHAATSIAGTVNKWS